MHFSLRCFCDAICGQCSIGETNRGALTRRRRAGRPFSYFLITSANAQVPPKKNSRAHPQSITTKFPKVTRKTHWAQCGLEIRRSQRRTQGCGCWVIYCTKCKNRFFLAARDRSPTFSMHFSFLFPSLVPSFTNTWTQKVSRGHKIKAKNLASILHACASQLTTRNV